MSFLNATLIFGVAAIAVPIALHLLSRREPRKVVFPSVRFLTKRFESNRSRLRVRRWWLLALRIAAIAALALALARPVIDRSLSLTWLTIGLLGGIGVALLVMASWALAKHNSQSTGYALAIASLLAILAAGSWAAYTALSGPTISVDQTQPVALAIVLDNSPTSAWKTAGDNRIARMKELATWMVTRLPRSSRIAIIDRSAQVVSFSLDTRSALTRIEQLQPLEVVQPIQSRLEVAARLVRSSDLPERRVLVISDLSTGSWNGALADSSIATTFGNDPPVAVTLFDMGEFSGVNRSLTTARFADSSPPRGVPVPVSTTLTVVGGDPQAELSVTAELELYQNDPALPVVRDGAVMLPKIRSVDRTSVKVASGDSQELLLNIPALDVGLHHGRIRLIGEDAMPLDDTRYFSLQVLPPSRVLLVGDDEDEARIISDTITATAGGSDDTQAAFIVERIGYADLSVVRLEDFDTLMLLDPSRQAIVDPAVLESASSGGGVFICLGPAIGDEPLETPLLPSLVRRWRSPDPGTFFQVINASHGVTAPLSSDTPWSDFRVQQYWQVAPQEADSVLIQYAGTDHAALVERLIAGPNSESQSPGRVLVVTTPLPALAKSTRRWNDLFGTDPWPAWLLTRKSVEYLTGREAAMRTSTVGQPRLIDLNGEFENTDAVPSRLQLFRPDRAAPTPLNIPAGARKVAINDVSSSGTYWIRGRQVGDGFSANLAEDDLQLERVDKAQLDALFGPDRYGLATTREEIEFTESQTAQRVSLHSPAMLLALAIFLLEQILGNRFYRKPAPSAALASPT